MGKHTLNRLVALTVKTAQIGMHCDGGGLYLHVKKGADQHFTRSWIFRYATGRKATSASGKTRNVERQMGLGSVDTVTLSAARERARECRQLLQVGTDPIEAQRAAKIKALAAAIREPSFEECGKQYVADNEPGWRNQKHRAQWASTLRRYVYPMLGKLPVSTVNTGLVLQVIKPIWTTRPDTAGRVRGRIEAILDWAKVRGHRTGENPARWQGHLDMVLPKRSKVRRRRHHPALPYAEVPAFMKDLRARDGTGARALEFTVLCAARTGAVIGATWTEIDLEARVWTVPPDRTGAKITDEEPRPRRVPLPNRAVEILRALPRVDGENFVFRGRFGRGLSDMCMLEIVREMRPSCVTHGFRSSFKDWALETTAFPNEVSEAALWHVVEDETEAAYRRGDLFEKRRRLMAAWAEYCERGQPTAEVIPLNAIA
jgi:integrase